MNRNGLGREKAEKPSSGVVAEQCGRTAGENRGQATPMKREIGMPNRVDALVQAVQSPVAVARETACFA